MSNYFPFSFFFPEEKKKIRQAMKGGKGQNVPQEKLIVIRTTVLLCNSSLEVSEYQKPGTKEHIYEV